MINLFTNSNKAAPMQCIFVTKNKIYSIMKNAYDASNNKVIPVVHHSLSA